ncbi:MAG: hypothetical protein ACLQVD_08735 [Capsulimonadaceae bacterium]
MNNARYHAALAAAIINTIVFAIGFMFLDSALESGRTTAMSIPAIATLSLAAMNCVLWARAWRAHQRRATRRTQRRSPAGLPVSRRAPAYDHGCAHIQM